MNSNENYKSNLIHFASNLKTISMFSNATIIFNYCNIKQSQKTVMFCILSTAYLEELF